MGRRRNPWRGLVQDLWANGIVASALVPVAGRFALLRLQGFDLGRCRIAPGVLWFGSGPVHVGRGTRINRACVVNHSAAVTIGEEVSLGPGCMLLTASHEIGDRRRRCARAVSAPIEVGDGVWLGARVTVMPGVVIGPGAVVGAGSLVTSSVPPDTVYAGVPARYLRSLD